MQEVAKQYKKIYGTTQDYLGDVIEFLGKVQETKGNYTDKSWKAQDPQLPKSIWYLTDAQFLGFRVVRPLEIVDPIGLSNYWTNGVERD